MMVVGIMEFRGDKVVRERIYFAVTPPAAVLIRPDGYVGWVGDITDPGLPDALTTWFGPPTAP